jgi:hypothetical protein
MAVKSKPGKARAARRAVIAAGIAAAGAIAEAAGDALLDPDADFGGPELDAELEDPGPLPPAPPPPPSRGSPSEQPSAPPPGLIELGDPPSDSLAAQAWLHRAMIVSAHDAMNDSTISASTRRRELRTIATAAEKLMPDARRYEAEQLIKRDAAEIESRRKARARAAAERRPAAGGARVIPIRPPNETR